MKCNTCGNEFELKDSVRKYRTYRNKPLDICPHCTKVTGGAKASKTYKEHFVGEAKEALFEHRRQVNREKYGTDYGFQSKIVKDKMAATFQEKYGVDNAAKAEEVKQTSRETCQKKYGADTFLGSGIGKDKKNVGVMKKYGVDNVAKATTRSSHLSS